MKTYLICYDIPDDKRRLRVATLLEGYGERRQYSVFECNLKDAQFARLWERLGLLAKPEDSILSIPVYQRCRVRSRTLGRGQGLTDDPDFYLA